MRLWIKQDALIAYSTKTLKTLKPLIEMIDVDENAITERKTTELSRLKTNLTLKYR